MVDRYFPSVVGQDEGKVLLRGDILSEFAYVRRIPVNLEEHSERYEGLVNSILSHPNWRQYLSMKVVGAAIEKIGRHVSSL